MDSREVNTVGKLLSAVAESVMEDKDLYRHVESHEQFTYKEVQKHVSDLACGLPEGNLQREKRLAVIMQNDPEHFVMRLGALRIGLTLGHIDIKQFQPETVWSYLKSFQPHGIVLTPKYDFEKKIDYINDRFPEISENYEIGRPHKIREFPTLKTLLHTHKSKHYDGWHCYNDFFWQDPLPGTLQRVEQMVTPKDVAEMYFSRFFASKELIGFSQECVVQSALTLGAVLPLREKRVAFAGDYSTPEVASSMLACLAYGSYIVTSSYWLKVPNFLKDIGRERCDVLVASPSELRQLLAHPSAKSTTFYLESIVVINNPNDIASRDLLLEAKATLGAAEVETCFIADGCMMPFLHMKDADIEAMRPNQIGFPLLNTEVKVGTDNLGEVSRLDTPGRLLTKGVHMATAKFHCDADLLEGAGWLDTGVRASMNEHGHVIFVE